MNKVSVYIIAYNEADKIEAAINSVLWADEIVLVDSHSTDDTVAIAERLGARVVQVPFTSFGDLRNRAMAACEHDWIFSLDSDERCTPEARDEILACLQAPQAEAYYIPRRNFFMGQWIRYSGYYPDYRQPQLFKKGALVFKDGDPVHEEFRVVSSQPVAYLKNPIWQIPFARLGELMRKAERYSTLGAEKLKKTVNVAPCGRPWPMLFGHFSTCIFSNGAFWMAGRVFSLPSAALKAPCSSMRSSMNARPIGSHRLLRPCSGAEVE